METHVIKMVISFTFLLFNFNVFAQSKTSNITIWQSKDNNSLLIEGKDNFKMFYSDFDPLIFEKTENKYLLIKNKDIFAIKTYLMTEEEIIDTNSFKIKYSKKCSKRLSFKNKYLKNILTFKKLNELVEYDSIVFYEFLSNYSLSDLLIIENDTFKSGFYDKLLFNKVEFKKSENLYIDIFANQISNKISKIPPYHHEFEDGAFVLIIVYLNNGSRKEIKVKGIPKYIDEYVLPKDKRDRLKSLFKGVL
jgi:hypothetical protein